MPRRRRTSAPSGTVERRGERIYAKLSLVDGRRVLIRLADGLSDKQARAEAATLAKRAWNERWKKAPVRPTEPEGETFAAWFARWLAYCDERDIVSVRDRRAHFTSHINPEIGPLFIARVGRADIERVVQTLDRKIAEGAIRPKTARNVWITLRCAFKDACSSKRLDLRARQDNPTDNVARPEREYGERARTYLYPSEAIRLLACREVPVYWRRLYALAMYTCSRAGELRALQWDAVDLDRGVIHFRQASDRRNAGKVKRTKAGRARRIPIEPSLRPLLEALRRESDGEGKVHFVQVGNNAGTLRGHLKVAGLTRAELYPPSDDNPDVADSWAPLTFHDLRGTGVTWMALRGDEPLVIQQRAGHADFATTQRYLREAETLGADGAEPFPSLPRDLLTLSPAKCHRENDIGEKTA